MKYVTTKKWFGKLVIMALVLCMVISMTACGRNTDDKPGKETTGATETVGETTEPTTETTEPTTEQETTVPTESEPPAAEAPAPEKEKVYVTMYANGTVNYRTGPSTAYTKMGNLSRGDTVQVVKDSLTEDGWYEAQIDGVDYYIYGKYLSLTKPSEDSGSNSKGDTPSGSTGSTGPSAGNDSASGSSNGNTAGAYAGPADTAKGVSWDGVTPIVYTYTDGTTGTEPKAGATYESKPGITTTYIVYETTGGSSVNGVNYCDHCGKADGDGSNDTCVRWDFVSGDHTCPSCGATVPENTCHSCDDV